MGLKQATAAAERGHALVGVGSRGRFRPKHQYLRNRKSVRSGIPVFHPYADGVTFDLSAAAAAAAEKR